MTIQEALLTYKYFKRPMWDHKVCYFKAKTGPFHDLVDCDYFVTNEDGEDRFTTSLDVYGEEILATDYILFE